MQEDQWLKRVDERIQAYELLDHQTTEVEGEKPDILLYLQNLKDIRSCDLVPHLVEKGLFEDFFRIIKRVSRKIKSYFGDLVYSHEDMAQETLYRLTRSKERITSSASGYTFVTLRRLILDTMRKKSNSVTLDEFTDDKFSDRSQFDKILEPAVDADDLYHSVKRVFEGSSSKATFLRTFDMFIAFNGQVDDAIDTGVDNDEMKLIAFARQYYLDNYQEPLSIGAVKARIYRFRQLLQQRYPQFAVDRKPLRVKAVVPAEYEVSDDTLAVESPSDTDLVKIFQART